MSNEIMPVTGNNMTALQVVTNEANIQKLGQLYAQSGFFGQVTASTATAALVNCFLEGLSPVQYRAKYHLFENGQNGIKSDYIQREFHKLGGTWTFNQWDGDVCDMVFTYKGNSLPFKVTLDEFKKNGVAMSANGKTMKQNWVKFPREMLKARCMATAIRALCPEALEGMMTQEEVSDFNRSEAPRAAAPVRVGDVVEVVAKDVNYGTCPCGSVKGKTWHELPTDVLEKILDTPESRAKELTANHRNAIIDELEMRSAEAEGAAAGCETEVVEG